jgi:DNA-binding HxlR family transcriptional regulator
MPSRIDPALPARPQPIMALLEVLGRRRALRILWELRDGALHFRELAEACGRVPTGTLNQRLGELRAARIVEQTADGYLLTEQGRELGAYLLALNAWARRWIGKTPGQRPSRRKGAGGQR